MQKHKGYIVKSAERQSNIFDLILVMKTFISTFECKLDKNHSRIVIPCNTTPVILPKMIQKRKKWHVTLEWKWFQKVFVFFTEKSSFSIDFTKSVWKWDFVMKMKMLLFNI